jgi:hypothetical protein
MKLDGGLTPGSHRKHQCRVTSQIQGLDLEAAIGEEELCKQRSRDGLDKGDGLDFLVVTS